MNSRYLHKKYVGQTSPEPYGLEVAQANGIYIYDTAGKEYIDLISGIGPAAAGHSHPKIIEALNRQAKKYMHTMVYGEHVQSPQTELAQKLASWSPDSMNSTYFLNSGAEAIEVAMKIARKYTGRYEFIACKNAYHGATIGASSLMSNEWLTRVYRPLMPGTRFITYDDISDLSRISTRTAAVFVETFQGEAGCQIAHADWFHKLRERCSEMGCLLIVDEIQVGLGRTGKHFAFEHYAIEPDIIVLAKALGGGLPLAAVHSRQSLIKCLSENPILGHCTTFGGNPMSCVTGKASLEVIEEHYRQAIDKEELFRAKLSNLPHIRSIRGKGLWLAVELGSFEKIQKLMWNAKSMGLITDWFLFNTESFRICPPLTITAEEIEKSCKILEAVLQKL